MSVRVLVADDDLDVQELVNDILLINFTDVSVERVLDVQTLRKKLGAAKRPYDLIIATSALADPKGTSALSIIRNEFAAYRGKTVILEDTAGKVPRGAEAAGIPILTKPFSLDEFGDIVRKICPR
jgi:DNA-binding response OmpR family regulator